MKKLLLMTLLLLLFLPSGIDVDANLSDLQRAAERANAQVRETQGQVNALQAAMDILEREMKEIDEKLAVIENELHVTGATLDETLLRLEAAELELDSAREDYDRQLETFKIRVRVLHEQGQISYLEVLFNASSFQDFITRLEYINIIAVHDQQMTDRLLESERQIAQKLEDINRDKNLVEALRYKLMMDQEQYEHALDEANAYFAVLFADENFYSAQLLLEKEEANRAQAAYTTAQREEDARRAAEAARRLAANPPVEYNGVFRWPAPNYKTISSPYGNRRHPISGRSEHHNGVDISSNSGNSLLAAESGTVIFAAYNGGMGNTVIIDHGDGLGTLYGHASRILVTVGQRVTQGQEIAKVGSTGIATGPHLHFEVHENGKHVNPRSYLGY